MRQISIRCRGCLEQTAGVMCSDSRPANPAGIMNVGSLITGVSVPVDKGSASSGFCTPRPRKDEVLELPPKLRICLAVEAMPDTGRAVLRAFMGAFAEGHPATAAGDASLPELRKAKPAQAIDGQKKQAAATGSCSVMSEEESSALPAPTRKPRSGIPPDIVLQHPTRRLWVCNQKQFHQRQIHGRPPRASSADLGEENGIADPLCMSEQTRYPRHQFGADQRIRYMGIKVSISTCLTFPLLR